MIGSFFKNVVVRVPNWIGDAVMCTPALMDLRDNFPCATITLWARPAIVDLLRGCPVFDNLLIDDRKEKQEGLAGTFSLISMINKRHFDLTVLFPNAFDSAWMTFLARIPHRWGYAADGRKWLLTKAIPVPAHRLTTHHVYYYQGLIQGLGLQSQQRAPSLPIHPDAERQVNQKFPELSVGNRTWFVGVNPGAVYGSAKRWLPERFAEVAETLVNRLQEDLVPSQRVQCVVVGGPGEESLGQRLASSMRSSPVVLSGKTSVGDLMVILKRCSVFITNDTGPMHMADALGVPTISIFGPTNPRRTAPFRQQQGVVHRPVSCAPCRFRHCPIDHRCMTGISVDDVLTPALEQVRRLHGSQKNFTVS